jgi:HAD domain in Swiss Army Knife RNA repair proteins
MKPILFLDIDGVLNSQSWYRRRPERPWCDKHEIDPEAFFLLRAVVAMTGCEIVISSSWRIGRSLEELRALLPSLPIIDKTPVMTTGHTRGAEVDQWLKAHPEVTAFACIDDDGDLYEHQNLVRTDWNIGLTPKHAELLVDVLTC